MSIVLARIDDRYIHGQVTVGWSRQLCPDRILLADNTIAADPWQSRVYASSVPPEIKVTIESVARAAADLESADTLDERVLLLTGGVAEMTELVHMGAPVSKINVGGLHFSAGKKEMLPFVFVDAADLKALVRLLDAGVALFAQQVPGGREYVLDRERLKAMEDEL
ncbi:MAG: mannose/fructose/N-acetylgalactosamine-specific phosphotransferase system component IIB [Candidatus Krumholzibacteriia bacterium]|jgi:mannose/fructose/N-acetylgalactosamine-specific phosphotransferase system component IIB